MLPLRRAVIDVGTNSVKLLVADVIGREVHPVWEGSQQTRLGEGFYEARQLQPGPIGKTAQAVGEFASKARQAGAGSIRVIATSATREALNASVLTSALERTSGLKVEVISGEQEADWAFQGVTTDSALRQALLLLVDVGGGSTQFILGQGDRRHFLQSYPVGTVRLLERMPPGDPPRTEALADCRRWLKSFLQQEVVPRLGPALRRESDAQAASGGTRLVGVGGTASILGCIEARLTAFDRALLEAARLTRPVLERHQQRLWALPLARRKEVVGLPANRADVILAGIAIYGAVMEEFDFQDLRISTRGLRFAAVLETGPVAEQQ